jgi:hypothetical protein
VKVKTIKLTQGLTALVDDEDYERISAFKWHTGSGGYARRNTRRAETNGAQKTVLMHRQVLGLAQGDAAGVDHVNGNKADNRKVNLRLCDQTGNNANSALRESSTSGFKGVSYHKQRNKWQASIGFKGQVKYLGLYETAEEAHQVYLRAAEVLFGEFANSGARI